MLKKQLAPGTFLVCTFVENWNIIKRSLYTKHLKAITERDNSSPAFFFLSFFPFLLMTIFSLFPLIFPAFFLFFPLAWLVSLSSSAKSIFFLLDLFFPFDLPLLFLDLLPELVSLARSLSSSKSFDFRSPSGKSRH